MSIRYDEKGKFFTDVITKDVIPSIIQTTTNHIKGNVHVRVNERIKDELNRGEQFLAVTEAEISSLQGEALYTADFMILNRNHVIWIVPDEDKAAPQSS